MMGKYYGTVIEGIFINGALNGFGRCLYERFIKIGHFKESKRHGNNYCLILNHTIVESCSGWFQNDEHVDDFKEESKELRFFTAEQCFSNEEPFLPDKGDFRN